MSKHHQQQQQSKARPTNRLGTSISIEPQSQERPENQYLPAYEEIQIDLPDVLVCVH